MGYMLTITVTTHVFFLKGAHCAVFFGEKLRGRGSNPRRRSRDAEFTVDRRLSNLRSISFPFPVPRKPLTSPFSLPFPISPQQLTGVPKRMERVVAGAQILSFICGSRLSASHLSPSPPSLSYSLSSISTGSLVRRNLDLGCEARGVRRTLGAWAAEPVARGTAALCFLHGRARRGASSAAARGKARERWRVTRRGTTSSSSSRRPAGVHPP